MAFLYGALMFIGLIGLLVCSKKQKQNPKMQPLALVLFVVVVIGAIMLIRELDVFPNSSKLIDNERAFYSSQGFAAGNYLKSLKPGAQVLVLAEPNYAQNENIKMLIEQFKLGYGAESLTVVTPTIPAKANQEEGIPLYMQLKAKDFDKMLADNASAKIVFNMIGLPEDAPRMKYWSTDKAKRPLFFMLNDYSGTVRSLDVLIAKGDLAGIIISNPKAKYDVKAPSDMLKAFDIRYVLVNKNNIAQYKSNLQ